MTRVRKDCALRDWGLGLARRISSRKAKVAISVHGGWRRALGQAIAAGLPNLPAPAPAFGRSA